MAAAGGPGHLAVGEWATEADLCKSAVLPLKVDAFPSKCLGSAFGVNGVVSDSAELAGEKQLKGPILRGSSP